MLPSKHLRDHRGVKYLRATRVLRAVLLLMLASPAIAAAKGSHELVVRYLGSDATYKHVYPSRAACMKAKADVLQQAAELEARRQVEDRKRNWITNRPQPDAFCVPL